VIRPLVAALIAALAIVGPSTAAPPEDRAISSLMAREQQLFAVGWKLAAANATYCKGAVPALGLQPIDARTFANLADAMQQLGLRGEIGVGTVGPGSPAARAGIAPGDTLIAVDDVAVTTLFPPTKPNWQRPLNVSAALEAAARRGPVTLTIRAPDNSSRVVLLAPVTACPSLFQVYGRNAGADGSRVRFGQNFPAFAYPEPEFAAAVAHEFAHNVLGHRTLLDGQGRSLGNQRASEREADRLMPWLLVNAGYDPAAALAFMRRWGPRHDGGLFRNRDHEGWDERADAIRKEVEKVQDLIATEGRADWARHFTRERLTPH